jgi:hypothetical protein
MSFVVLNHSHQLNAIFTPLFFGVAGEARVKTFCLNAFWFIDSEAFGCWDMPIEEDQQSSVQSPE